MDGNQLLEQLNQLKHKGYIVIMGGVSTQVISSVEGLVHKYGLNYIGTLLKPIHELDFNATFEKKVFHVENVKVGINKNR